MHTKNGFTLIEFVIALCIAAILWGLAFGLNVPIKQFRASLYAEQYKQLVLLALQSANLNDQAVQLVCENQSVFVKHNIHDAIFAYETITLPQTLAITCPSVLKILPGGNIVNHDNAPFEQAIPVVIHDIKMFIDPKSAYVYENS